MDYRDLTDQAVAFWDGSKVVYAFFSEDGSGQSTQRGSRSASTLNFVHGQ
jgi:hypothetical protein